jgi:hypothetical protein
VPATSRAELYRLDGGEVHRPRVTRLDGKPVYAHSDSNIFNRLTGHMGKGYIFFPYGYQYRMAGHGPLDDFGHRIDGDLNALANRPSHHKVVATFGGSTTWSIDCFHSETYTSRLEALLKSTAAQSGQDTVYTCLNFGQIAYSVLSEITTFILHAWRARPDIVIAHDGWNDLLYGSYVDPNLVQEHGIVYPDDLEPWAQRIHGRNDLETTKTGPLPFPLRSAPSEIISAYLFRKHQFKTIVESTGATFVWGLQPNLTDKQQRTEAEQRFADPLDPSNSDDWRYVRARVPQLCRIVAESCQGRIAHFVDLAEPFAKLSPQIQHFTDMIHLTPAGDNEVARVYHQYIVEHGLA